MKIRLPAIPLAGYLFPLAAYALCALLLAACFGGEDDGSTVAPEGPGTSTSARKITPGLYLGDYSRIDTNRFAGMESEFLMDADGSFTHLFIYRDEALFVHNGRWGAKRRRWSSPASPFPNRTKASSMSSAPWRTTPIPCAT